MSFFKMLFKTAKEMDKQRFKEMDRQKKLQEKQQVIKLQTQLVDEYAINLMNLYNEWAEYYNKNEDLREHIDIETDLDSYLASLDAGILLTKDVYDKIELLPNVYELPNSAQEYIREAKGHLLLNLEYHTKRDETAKNGILEFIHNGEIVEHPAELANQYLNKAHLYLESSQSNMQRARQSIQNS